MHGFRLPSFYPLNLFQQDLGITNVRVIGNAAFTCSDITSITLPPSLAEIGNQALAYCENLSDIVFLSPYGVNTYDYQVFGVYGSSSAENTTIHVPSTVQAVYEDDIDTDTWGTEHLSIVPHETYGTITAFGTNKTSDPTQIELATSNGSIVQTDAENYVVAIGEQVLGKDITDAGTVSSEEQGSTGTAGPMTINSKLVTSLFIDCDVPDNAFTSYIDSAVDLPMTHTITILSKADTTEERLELGNYIFRQDTENGNNYLSSLKTIKIAGNPIIKDYTFGGLPNTVTFETENSGFLAEDGALYDAEKTNLIS